MSSQPLALSLVPAELPDWILALKPPDADVAEPTESAVFIGLDTELELPMQTNPVIVLRYVLPLPRVQHFFNASTFDIDRHL